MKKTKSYTSKDIDSLTDNEHVRLRTQVYFGNTKPSDYKIPIFHPKWIEFKDFTFIPAVYKAVGEIIDNSIDEFTLTGQRNAQLNITADPDQGHYIIADNGRGVPIDKHAKGIPTPEVVFNELRSGRNFKSDKDAGVLGQNGVGSACVNFCSTEFKVDITRDGKKYKQTFKNGGTKKTNARTTKVTSKKSGTQISFKLDDKVFTDISLPAELVENRAHEIVFNNPSITINYNKKKIKSKGFEEYLKTVSTDYYKFETKNMEFYTVFDVYQGGPDERFYTWVNSSLLFEGGLCNTQFMNAFTNMVVSATEREAKKEKIEITKSDIKPALLIFGFLKVQDPDYDAQSKTRYTGPSLRDEFQQLIDKNQVSFKRKNKEWLGKVIQRGMIRCNKLANKDAEKALKRRSTEKIVGLLEASSKNRKECRILITEGKSAKSMIADVRNPVTDATYALTGKINNTHGTSVAQVMKMGKVTELFAVIGLVPGQPAVRSKLNYGQIIISTDADYDGDDIFTLMINMFYTFWPELLDPKQPPIIHRLVAPNVVAYKGKKRVHFPTVDKFRKGESKYTNGWNFKYMKGLGSMIKADWNILLGNPTEYLLPIYDDGDLKATLELLFGENTDARKRWLTT